MLTPFSKPARLTAMNSSAVPWNQVAIMRPSSCHTPRKRSQSPASRHTTQFSTTSRIASRSCIWPCIGDALSLARHRPQYATLAMPGTACAQKVKGARTLRSSASLKTAMLPPRRIERQWMAAISSSSPMAWPSADCRLSVSAIGVPSAACSA